VLGLDVVLKIFPELPELRAMIFKIQEMIAKSR